MEQTAKPIQIPQRKPRTFLPENFQVTTWDQIVAFYEDLKKRNITSESDLRKWFADRSELESVLAEDLAWRYIKMTCDTKDETIRKNFEFFVTEIQPHTAVYTDALNNKALESPYLAALEKEDGYHIMIRSLKKEAEIFRKENIPLLTEMQTKESEYGAIIGAMTVEVDGKTLTLQQASDFLESTNREKREEVYRKLQERRYQDKDKLDTLFNQLRDLRHQVAQNAGFANFRDYMFKALGRFDYTPQDCFDFHKAIKQEVVPIIEQLTAERKKELNLSNLRPWDLKVDPQGLAPLKPFSEVKELTTKTIACFSELDPFLGECITIMQEMKHLDLESRIGKAPGGYNYPLAEIGVPFIFMNATSNLRDLTTLLHEGGHAVHSFLTKDLTLNAFKNTPSEIAEVASMSMELITMDHWDLFFTDKEDLKRAKIQNLEQVIDTLPWVATIDKFQHWLYENPTHTIEERKKAWTQIYEEFSSSLIDWSSLENYKAYLWQKQLHIFEVPFYYVEYAIAQLGAIAIWKNYKENPKKGLTGYMNALKLGYTKSLSEIYKAANIQFNFSHAYVKELMQFVKNELEILKK